MTKHTPGPWTQPETKRTHNRWFVEGGGRLVAAASGPQFAIPADEADANARLIASAPELLAAVNRLLNTMNHVYVSQPTHEDLPAWAEAQQQARAAIAKATGD
jgi:hypothetical protein